MKSLEEKNRRQSHAASICPSRLEMTEIQKNQSATNLTIFPYTCKVRATDLNRTLTEASRQFPWLRSEKDSAPPSRHSSL